MSNANFRMVKNAALQFSDLSAADASISNLRVSNLASGDILLTNHGYMEGSIVGFAPTGFATLAAASVLNLVKTPGAVPTGVNYVSLPAGSIVKRVHLDNDGAPVASAGTLDIGHGPQGIASTNLITGTTAALINATGGVYRNFENDLSNGVATGENPPAAALVPTSALLPGGNLVFVAATGAAVTAGDLRVAIEYCQTVSPL